MNLPDRIPVFLLSGFLGSGKSTLLNAYLTESEGKDTAIIINEFGDVPVDHLLVRKGETTISKVSTGCLCCSDTTDLAQTLEDLRNAALDGQTGSFSRVIVEMSGLGDPAPLVNALTVAKTADRQIENSCKQIEFYLAGVVTLFDTLAGAVSVENHFEAIKQIAFADQIVLTKTDLAEAKADAPNLAAIWAELRELNASAAILDRQNSKPSDLFSPRAYAVVDRGEDVAGWLALEAALACEATHASQGGEKDNTLRHSAGIRTFTITCDQPVPSQRFDQFLSLLQRSSGQRLLRVKGILATEDAPAEPLIIHAVQHTVSKPVRLPAWPDEDHRTRLVFITEGVDPEPVRELFEAVIHAAPFSFTGFIKGIGRALRVPFLPNFSSFTSISRRSQ